jgi:dihydrofolate synthase/folylpolyglutamate synthase
MKNALGKPEQIEQIEQTDKTKELTEELLEELYSYSMHGIKLGLENIKKICIELGNPQNNYRIIHIAGTNGKGSTTATIDTVLREAGYKVGRYISPHILAFNERISANGKYINNKDLAKYYDITKKAIERAQVKPTFFEVTTALMFKYFSDLGLDFVILETGMGGRFDATNIAKDEICVVTNVSLEHTEYLGSTIYDISKEKAGIIKDCKKIVIGDNNPDFIKAIEENRSKDSFVINVLEKYINASYSLDFENFNLKIDIDDNEYNFSLFGDYQFKNFLCAYEVLKLLNIDENIIKSGISKVSWECRFEIFNKNPLVILDGAHNEAGIIELAKIIKKGFSKDEIVIITSILKDKNIEKMIKILEELSDNIIFTSIPDNPRGQMGEDIAKFLSDKNKGKVENDIISAYEVALKINKRVILICGSFYLLSEFKEKYN